MGLVKTEHTEFKLTREYPRSRQYLPLDPEYRDLQATIVLDMNDELISELTGEETTWLVESVRAMQEVIDQWEIVPSLLICDVAEKYPPAMLDGWEVTRNTEIAMALLDTHCDKHKLDQTVNRTRNGVFVIEFDHRGDQFAACVISAVQFEGFIQHVTFAVRKLE